jgi:hypothetical protein
MTGRLQSFEEVLITLIAIRHKSLLFPELLPQRFQSCVRDIILETAALCKKHQSTYKTRRRTARQATKIPKDDASFAINPYSKSISLEG